MCSFYETVQQFAADRPDGVAVRRVLTGGGCETVTYGQLAKRARQFADAFDAHARDAAIVPLYLTKSPDGIAAMLGANGAGKAFAWVHHRMRGTPLSRILKSIASPIALIDGSGITAMRDITATASTTAGIHLWIVNRSTFTKAQQADIEDLATAVRVTDCHDLLSAIPLPSPGDHPRDPCGVGCVLFTSGSTGTPKGVRISASDLLARADAEIEWYGLTERDVLLSILPFSFDVGLNQLLSALRCGCQIILQDSWLPADILDTAAQYHVTGISGVPSIWRDMIRSGLTFDTKARHKALRYITISGGDLNEQHLERMPALADGAGIFKTYGQTEAFRATALRPDEFATRPQSVGRPFGGARVYVVNDAGEQCRPSEIGQIVHAGMGTMLGYVDGDDPQNKLRPNPFCGPDDPAPHAIFTGDEGYLDEAGYLFVTGRRDDMLKIADNRVYPLEVVNQLLSFDSIDEAEAVGINDRDGRTHLLAFIVVDDAEHTDALALRRHLAAQAPPYMVPEQIIVQPALPRAPSGKTDRQALIAMGKTLINQDRTLAD